MRLKSNHLYGVSIDRFKLFVSEFVQDLLDDEWEVWIFDLDGQLITGSINYDYCLTDDGVLKFSIDTDEDAPSLRREFYVEYRFDEDSFYLMTAEGSKPRKATVIEEGERAKTRAVTWRILKAYLSQCRKYGITPA